MGLAYQLKYVLFCPQFLISSYISILRLVLKIQSPSSRNNECGKGAHDPPTATNKTDHHQGQSYLIKTHFDPTCNFVLFWPFLY